MRENLFFLDGIKQKENMNNIKKLPIWQLFPRWLPKLSHIVLSSIPSLPRACDCAFHKLITLIVKKLKSIKSFHETYHYKDFIMIYKDFIIKKEEEEEEEKFENHIIVDMFS